MNDKTVYKIIIANPKVRQAFAIFKGWHEHQNVSMGKLNFEMINCLVRRENFISLGKKSYLVGGVNMIELN